MLECFRCLRDRDVEHMFMYMFDGRKVLDLSFSFDMEAFKELLIEVGSRGGEAAA